MQSIGCYLSYGLGAIMGWMVVFKIHVWRAFPQCDGSWRGCLWEVISVRRSVGCSLHDGIGALVTDTKATLPSSIILSLSLSLSHSFPSAHKEVIWSHSKMTPSYELREDDTYLANTLTLDFQPSELWEINFYCLGCPSYCILYVSLSWQGQGPLENICVCVCVCLCVCEPGMVRRNSSVVVFTLRPLWSLMSQLIAGWGGPTSTSHHT